MPVITFRPKQVTKKLISTLPDRGQDILTKRFGIGSDDTKMTLEAIGGTYGITRERVRQLENFALDTIRKSNVFLDEQQIFDELVKIMSSFGGIVAEEDLLGYISQEKSIQNHITLLLVLGEQFKREKENNDFKHRWIVNEELSEKVHEALKNLSSNISNDDLLSEEDITVSFLEYLKDVPEEHKNEETIKRWLSISKEIGKNPLGEWGAATSPNVKARGMKDYAFLVIRRHGSPMHFTEVASAISDIFGRSAHVATCHNELIKDNRFVLVGRGLYALSDWGYEGGVVKDVIKNILKKYGALTKDEIVEKVMKERYVKENTVIVNLQDTSRFKKNKKGKYSVV
jgi:hypothetical protein